MARYIDADALKLDIDMSQGATITDFALSVIRAVQNAPTADVVPKSDWLEALALIEQYEKTIDNGVEACNGCHAKYDEKIRTAKVEVAREIFAEIEGEINNLEYRVKTPRKTVKIEELKAQVNWVLHDVVPQTLAKLKKKYTGATDTNDDCKTEGD